MRYDNFYFNGKWLADYNASLYDGESDQMFPAREIIFTGLSSTNSHTRVFGTKYSDTLELHGLICKDPDFYLTQEEREFTDFDIRNIKSWLMSPKLPMELIPYGIDMFASDVSYFGIFTEIQPFLVSERCYGLYYTFKCDSPHGYSGLYTKEYDLSNISTLDGKFYNSSDELCDYLYPQIKVYVSSRIGTLTIKNNTDNGNEMKVNLINCEYFVIDTYNMMAYDNKNNPISLCDLGWTVADAIDQKIYWFRLLPGENNLTFSTSAFGSVEKIEFSARFVRKTGGFL